MEENTTAIVENRLNEYRHRYPRLEQSDSEDPVLLMNANITLTTKEPDNFVITKEGVVVIESICLDESGSSEIIIMGRQFNEVTVLYQAPVTEQKLLLVADLSPVYAFKASEVQLKAVKFDTTRGICVLPLIV